MMSRTRLARIERGVGRLIDHLDAAQHVLVALLERRRQDGLPSN